MLIVLAISVTGNLLLPEVAASILSLGLMIGFGLFGNQLYMKHATRKILCIKSHQSNNTDYNTTTRRLRVNGGTTIAPIIAAIILFIAIFLLLILYVLIYGSYVLY